MCKFPDYVISCDYVQILQGTFIVTEYTEQTEAQSTTQKMTINYGQEDKSC